EMNDRAGFSGGTSWTHGTGDTLWASRTGWTLRTRGAGFANCTRRSVWAGRTRGTGRAGGTRGAIGAGRTGGAGGTRGPLSALRTLSARRALLALTSGKRQGSHDRNSQMNLHRPLRIKLAADAAPPPVPRQ